MSIPFLDKLRGSIIARLAALERSAQVFGCSLRTLTSSLTMLTQSAHEALDGLDARNPCPAHQGRLKLDPAYAVLEPSPEGSPVNRASRATDQELGRPRQREDLLVLQVNHIESSRCRRHKYRQH